MILKRGVSWVAGSRYAAPGVISEMDVTFKPMACTARMADSRPGPGPLTYNATSCKPMAIAALNGLLGSQTSCKGSAFAGALKANRSSAPPGQRIALLVCYGDNRVVERRVDVHLSRRQGPLDFLDAALAACGAYTLSHSTSPNPEGYFFEPRRRPRPATVFLGPLRVREFVRVRWPRTGRLRRWRSPR